MRGPLALALAVALVPAACGSDAPGIPSRSPSVAGPTSPEPTASPSAPAPDLRAFRGRLEEVARLEQPIAMAVRPDDPTLYVAQKTGQVVALAAGAPTTILDLSSEVSQGFEQGLLGAAFSPDGRFLYVNFTGLEGDTHVIEFGMDGSSVVERSRRDVLVVDQPYSNHNGGHLAFGPDGYLYIGLGDGGSGGDPMDNAQHLGRLLGKMLRIDPRPSGGRAYTIPRDNPFVGREAARPEIWAYGLRNPWRYSFDRETGDLWIGDVGQGQVEEIDRQPADSPGGENYGWDGYEGTLEFEPPLPEDAVAPVHEYGQQLGRSVIGGYVYRGAAIPALRGAYVFGDFYGPELRALVPGPGGRLEVVPLGVAVPDISSLAEDGSGELYALSLSGGVYRLTP